ncbi:MAG: PA0069 family radical SAM protein [Alphaproteobacteria bacterium]|nr:PA0069 family radical SAM protein [Alphaproteobacteria bacterium]MDX5414792.1 PA0069 family radical SAM protein [Alphaproteobacteria bacterium]MDX5491973.1 PA0069 family radical SAM protein [Alphaproteobacteria bacterium]
MTTSRETAPPGHPAHHADSPVGPRAAKRPHGLTDHRPVPRRAPLVPPSVREPHLPESGRRGRGALTNRSGRYEPQSRELADDGWDSLEDLPALKTQVTEETARHIVTRNSSPDIPFDRSINAYRGCEHGCVYCFARPTHAYMGLSPGLDFESKLFAKPNAAQLLEKELARPGYEVAPIAIGTNTDPYQPIEQRYRITRSLLEVLSAYNHPVTILTKSARIVRDIDILSSLAERNLVRVALSVTTLDPKLARALEPRASTPSRRMEAIRLLSEAGIPTSAMIAPIIPALNDMEIEKILTGLSHAGAREANFVILRLPLEIRDIFVEWLNEHVPDRANRVLSLIRQMRGGKDYDATWGERQSGTGPYAWQIARRFEIATKKLGIGYGRREIRSLDCTKFRVPGRGQQLELL